MTAHIAWNCDKCGKNGLILSRTGIIYCPICRTSYGKTIKGMINNERNRKRNI